MGLIDRTADGPSSFGVCIDRVFGRKAGLGEVAGSERRLPDDLLFEGNVVFGFSFTDVVVEDLLASFVEKFNQCAGGAIHQAVVSPIEQSDTVERNGLSQVQFPPRVLAGVGMCN